MQNGQKCYSIDVLGGTVVAVAASAPSGQTRARPSRAVNETLAVSQVPESLFQDAVDPMVTSQTATPPMQ
eukprot:5642273-Amphidinium_carterae.1